VPHCPKGHELQRYSAPDDRFCDLCKKAATRGSELWGCRQCNWDACPGCHKSLCPGSDKSLAPGDLVEVYSNSHLSWCQGRVVSVTAGDMVIVAFRPPGAGPDEFSNKTLPVGHQDLRRALTPGDCVEVPAEEAVPAAASPAAQAPAAEAALAMAGDIFLWVSQSAEAAAARFLPVGPGVAEPEIPAAWEIDLGGQWQRLGEEEIAIIEGLQRSGRTADVCLLRGQHYTLDLVAMTQTNQRTGKVRQLRGPSAPTAAVPQAAPPRHASIDSAPPAEALVEEGAQPTPVRSRQQS